ncbi:MAG: nucleotide exchange factor GrpE, partial [Bacteroidota bacterium]
MENEVKDNTDNIDLNGTENKSEVNQSTEENNQNSTQNSEDKNEQIESDLKDENSNKITELEAKLAEEKDRFLRLYSEFDNYKKRTMRERTELLKSAGEDVFKLILPALDDFERAILNNETATDIDVVKEGFHLIFNKFRSTLESKGLKPMSAKGESFDSELH